MSKAYRENFSLIDWGPPRELPKKTDKPKGPSGPYFMGDIQPFVSPLDFSVVSSRSTLREHERKHGVRQVGELKSARDFDNSSKRSEAFKERAFDQAFRHAVEKTGL